MPIPAFFAPVLTWVFREVLIKFVLFTSIIAVVVWLVPKAVGYLLPFIGVGNLTAAFSQFDSGVWFWLDFFRLNVGVPLLISAYVSRFLIRRLPVIG